MNTISTVSKDIELSKLLKNKYFDQRRIDQVKSLDGFNLQYEQIITTKKSIKCYVLSDIHADSEKNQVWVRERCLRSAEDVRDEVFTVFIVPGDIGSEIDRIESVLVNLVNNYDAVCYLPGNHEAWRKGTAAGGSALLVNDPNYKRPDNRMASDSVAKLVEVVECARKCGVYVGPLRVVLAGASADAAADSGTASDVSTAQNSVESVADEVSAVLSVAADVSSNPRPEPVTLNSLRLDDISTSLGANCSDTVTAIATDAATTEKETAVVIMPLYGWYHSSWDTEPEITDPQFVAVERAIPFSRKWGDYAMCTWPRNIISHEEFVKNPLSSTTLAETFAKLNEPFLHPPPYKKVSNDGEDEITEEGGGGAQMRRYFGTPLAKSTDTIISYSHYLPRLELCPEKRFLSEPMLSKVIGSDVLESQVRRLQPHLHLYGHTHIPIDLELEGIRYLQWPLGYFREAHLQCAPIYSTGPLLVHDSALGAGKQGIPARLASEGTAWTKHYRSSARDSSSEKIVNDLAPWVRARLQAFS